MTRQANRYIQRQQAEQEMTPVLTLRPSYMVAGSVLARYYIGTLLILGLGAIYVPEGEYDQYIVSHRYAIHSLAGWVCITIFAALGYWIMNRLQRGKNVVRSKKPVIFSKYWLTDKKNIERITWICIASGIVQLAFVIVAITTGSEDRGSMYEFWATQKWKPTSLFISIERLYSIFYCLVPLVIVKNGLKKKTLVVSLYTVLTIASFSLSGRGTFLYPLLYTLVGMGAVVRKEILVKWTIGFALLATVMVPGMAAIRDLPSYENFGSTSLIERALLYVRPSSYGENMTRRLFAMGREVYACSDGFVYRDADNERYGFGDMNIEDLGRLALPRFMGGHKERMDGSRIAQQYMGVWKETWFPCITLQADLYRRGGTIAIAAGGLVFGAGLYILDKCWIRVYRGSSMFNIVLTILPITILKTAPTGTVREVISFVVYEITKYVIIAWSLALLESWFSRKSKT